MSPTLQEVTDVGGGSATLFSLLSVKLPFDHSPDLRPELFQQNFSFPRQTRLILAKASTRVSATCFSLMDIKESPSVHKTFNPIWVWELEMRWAGVPLKALWNEIYYSDVYEKLLNAGKVSTWFSDGSVHTVQEKQNAISAMSLR